MQRRAPWIHPVLRAILRVLTAPDSALAQALGGYAPNFVRHHLWEVVRRGLAPGRNRIAVPVVAEEEVSAERGFGPLLTFVADEGAGFLVWADKYKHLCCSSCDPRLSNGGKIQGKDPGGPFSLEQKALAIAVSAEPARVFVLLEDRGGGSPPEVRVFDVGPGGLAGAGTVVLGGGAVAPQFVLPYGSSPDGEEAVRFKVPFGCSPCGRRLYHASPPGLFVTPPGYPKSQWILAHAADSGTLVWKWESLGAVVRLAVTSAEFLAVGFESVVITEGVASVYSPSSGKGQVCGAGVGIFTPQGELVHMIGEAFFQPHFDMYVPLGTDQVVVTDHPRDCHIGIVLTRRWIFW